MGMLAYSLAAILRRAMIPPCSSFGPQTFEWDIFSTVTTCLASGAIAFFLLCISETAAELEHPFGEDMADIDLKTFQEGLDKDEHVLLGLERDGPRTLLSPNQDSVGVQPFEIESRPAEDKRRMPTANVKYS
jgi:predicted membrane chloride channel (bestrophin family)